MPEYQVFHQQAVKSFSAGEDNEHQRRWTESQWEAKASNKKFNYDKSRAHLNFEIVRGGKIVPLGSSKPILERFQDRLKATGAEDPNKGLETPKYRIACNMIFSGDADRMREMAFGNQNVERAKGADNSHVKRKAEIELWAKDIYKAVADAWGEDNIIDFSVHLDESSPHIHCLVTPIMYDEKKQKMRIKYRDTFGGDANKLDAIHDYLAEVNKKWGLVRGESVSATNAQHVPRDEWYRQLQAESRELEIANGKLELDIRRKENAVKGLKTMIGNLTHQKSEVENKIHEVEKQLEQQNGEHSELSKELERLKSQLSTLEFKLTDKREKLSAADEALAEFRAMTRAQKSEAETLRVVQEQTSRTLQTYAQASILAGSFQELLTMSSRICANVPEAKKMAENTIIEDMCDMRFKDVLGTAVKMFIEGVNGATSITQSGGGGGSNSELPWRDKDEDIFSFARRCMRFAHRKHYPKKSSGIKR